MNRWNKLIFLHFDTDSKKLKVDHKFSLHVNGRVLVGGGSFVVGFFQVKLPMGVVAMTELQGEREIFHCLDAYFVKVERECRRVMNLR